MDQVVAAAVVELVTAEQAEQVFMLAAAAVAA
jgi:hypothetical protein